MTQQCLYTIPEAAKQLGIPVSTLRRAAKQALIPTYNVFSTRLRVRVSEVEGVISQMRTGGLK